MTYLTLRNSADLLSNVTVADKRIYSCSPILRSRPLNFTTHMAPQTVPDLPTEAVKVSACMSRTQAAATNRQPALR